MASRVYTEQCALQSQGYRFISQLGMDFSRLLCNCLIIFIIDFLQLFK